ncbi:MAG TPA: PDDEXK nuclease domain-containing protein [Bacteroidales bacterium]|nr:PDDEXK nuclease domain-containing protein [Bacteroidales bacterium]HPS16542.1 PDDEXK nuclease domain-containing protein [Bacteroidales bacterium]
MKFQQLSKILKQTNETLYKNVVKAVNVNLSIRNWLFGLYIIEFEQNGEDRAKYGEKLLQKLADTLSIKGLTAPELSRCRQFYLVYPQIFGTLSQKFITQIPENILGSVSQRNIDRHFSKEDNVFYSNLFATASFSHFVELVKINDLQKRRFYELLIIKTTPSVRELQRQIETLTYERFGLSANKELAFEQIKQKIEPIESNDLIKSHYFFDFLKIPHLHLVEESELEQALIDHLQEFILELGNGFCFEARQKRILIDDEYFFIDLVFYHRILKCHVLVELKTEYVKHEHIGQLKVYLQHYKNKVMTKDDNPPVGILLVTDKKKTIVEYAIADMDKKLFVSKYQLQLPDKNKLELFIKNEIENIESS